MSEKKNQRAQNLDYFPRATEARNNENISSTLDFLNEVHMSKI
jgi:hypothetical protein